ncbi:hypothetical protein [Pacificibacter sp. AS14]|uniref:hypothetical protein n=1 Tax=Pacificibacter sp. AS14 TaxID=3135785 RepID=UPI00317F8831
MVVYFKDWAAIEAYEDQRFDITGLTPAEKQLKKAVATGQLCDFSPNFSVEKSLPQKPEDWSKPDPTRHIRADVLRFVLLQKVAQIGEGFYFRKVQAVKGRIDLTSAKARDLADDAASWALVDDLILDGFRYDSISGNTKPTFSERMEWLEKGSVFEGEFRPQPYTQLAETYKRAGHDREAREVRVTLARKLAKEGWYDTHEKWLARELLFEAPYPFGQWIGRLLHKCLRLSVTTSKSFWDWLFRNVVGYGYKPFNSLWFLFGLIVAAWILAYSAWHEGQFAPNSAPILVSKAWTDLEADPKAAIKWSTKGNAGQDWETFNSFAYAADIVIPIVEIGQTSAWAPSPARGPWGATLWWARWVFTAAGWIISALGAAAITGVIRRE